MINEKVNWRENEMREFYIFDGEEYVMCSKALLSDLLELCEDNEVMVQSIKDYFGG